MTEDEQFHFTFSPKINESSKVLAEQKRARERLAVSRMETVMAGERQKQQQQQQQQEEQQSQQKEDKDDSGIPQASGSTSLPQGATQSKPPGPVKTFQRYSFESELTFAPRLNATSMRLARERERQGNVASSTAKQASEEEYMFTFQPRVSSSSRRIAQNLGTTFMARQQMHLERQRKLLEQGQLPSFKEPMQSRPKRLRHHKLLGEAKANLPSLPGNTSGEDGGQQDSSSDGGSDSGLTPRKRPMRGGEVSKSHPVPSLSNKLGASSNGPHGSRRKTLPPKYLPGLPDINNPPATAPPSHQRSQTLPPTTATSTSPRRRVNTAKVYANVTRVKNAKLAAERAMRMKRVFSIHGPYPFVRKALRERGWVERFIKPEVKERKRSSKEEDSDDDDDGDNGNSSDSDDDGVCDAVCQDSTTDADGGDGDTDNVYGIMVGNQEMLVSRMLRNANPSFIWTCRANTFDSRMLRKDQIYNHFTKANFTTKVGLCMNLRQLPWYEDTDANWFYPRCYRLSVDEEKFDFIDDYRLTAAASVLKVTLQHLRPESDTPSQTDEEEEEEQEGEDEENVPSDVDTPRSINSQKTNTTSTYSPRVTGRKQKKGGVVPTQVVQTSLTILDSFLSCLEHDDIEDGKEHFPPNLPEDAWNTFIQQYYTLVHDCGTLSTDSDVDVDRCIDTLEQFKEAWPQCQIDGTTNMWIVKPGAKSRGREIKVMNKLEDICKLVESTVVKKEGKWVVQKYIEDPLLIHNTKFDIRQWFLVTDWNPLTIWFYKDSYLRFCSQEFSLDNFHEAIHLSNNSVQKNYNSPRAGNIPANLMWHSKTFKDYLRSDGNGHMWESLVYSGMKQSVIYAMEASQDMIEGRKGSFELYGADFMLDTDLNPWLIEINSSPCMSPSTNITAEMCASVLEDTMKVVLDRRSDKNCDTGRFELAFKQSTIHIPPYIGISLSVEGQAIHRPVERRQSQANNGTSGNDSGNAPRDSNNPPANKTNSVVNSLQNGSSRPGNALQQSNSPPKITYSNQGHNKDSNVVEPGKNGGPPLPHGYHRAKAKSALMQSSRKTAVPAIRLYNNRSPNRQSMPLNRVEGSDFTNVEQEETATGEVTSDVPPQATPGMGLTCVSCGGVSSRKTSALPNKENLLFPVPRDVPIMPLPLAMQGIDLQPKMVAKNSVISINALPLQSDSVRIGFHRDATGHHLHRRHHLNNPHHPHFHEGRGINGKKKQNTVHRTVLNTGIVQPHVRPIAIVSQSYR
ncbi:tubulin tyrosine ligase 3-like isoform X1 [Branchiostoma lanceolatum]|uniref:tubulin tyrosine ligase 3-like isoform X1 n=1 Tax=Branchiostoma lanceolatum TaxID=7740 RepID=UPI003453C18C